MKILAVANQKGGVGKTVFSILITFFLRDKGFKVLAVDVDPQANLSKTLKKSNAKVIGSASELFTQELDKPDMSLEDQQVMLFEADQVLLDIERADPKVIIQVKSNLSNLAEDFDFCVIDTPPTLGLRMTAALVNANYVLSPIELEEYSIDGITKMLQTIFGVKQRWNEDLNFLGMVTNKFNSRSERQKETLNQLLTTYPQLIIPGKVGIRSSIPEALADGKAVWDLKKSSAAREASKEIEEIFNYIMDKMEVTNA